MSSKFWLLKASMPRHCCKWKSKTWATNPTIISSIGTRILTSSFFQCLKAPHATKRHFHDLVNAAGYWEEHERTQRKSRGNQKPTPFNSSPLIFHATIEQMTMNNCRFDLFQWDSEAHSLAAVMVVWWSSPISEVGASTDLSTF